MVKSVDARAVGDVTLRVETAIDHILTDTNVEPEVLAEALRNLAAQWGAEDDKATHTYQRFEQINQRFEQLCDHGHALLDADGTNGYPQLRPPIDALGWAAVCLDFLAAVFGKDSAHWELWHSTYGGVGDNMVVLARCVAHLHEARLDYRARYLTYSKIYKFPPAAA